MGSASRSDAETAIADPFVNGRCAKLGVPRLRLCGVLLHAGTIRERKRLSRLQFEPYRGTRSPCRIVMEACATSHFWARYLIARGLDVTLLPPHDVKPYRWRSKTGRADWVAILEADRCAGIHPVAIKSEDQQALVALHRVRSQWIASRTARINGLRALLRESGVAVPLGSKRFMNDLHGCSLRSRAGCRSACLARCSISGARSATSSRGPTTWRTSSMQSPRRNR
jgi:transposase